MLKVDIFTRTRLRGKTYRYLRLNLINIYREKERQEYDETEGNFTEADFLWVNPKLRKMPVLRLNLAHGGERGAWGIYLLVNFLNGIEGKATTQEIGSYDPPGPTYAHYTVFDKVDERGFMMVTEGQSDAMQAKDYQIDYRWLGDRFGAPSKRDTSVHYDKPNPLVPSAPKSPL